jgi:hypothetical protein
MNNLIRTDDWDRLKRSGYLLIDDQPGRITATGKKAGRDAIRKFKMIFVMTVALGFLPAVFGNFGAAILGGIVMTILASLTSGLMLISIRNRFAEFADKVVFTPTEVEFYRGRKSLGMLPRPALQQILADKDKHGLRYHRFIADVGFGSAFPSTDETEHVIINNILMAAFGQPVHLDGMNAVPVHAVDDAAPQIVAMLPVTGRQ